MDNNEMLARCYQPDVRQIVVVWPICWAHDRGGDWHIMHTFRGKNWPREPLVVADFSYYG